jgi:hypothetical protein
MGRDQDDKLAPDLFSAEGGKGAIPSSPIPVASKGATESAPQRHILPKNLRHAVGRLSDGDLDELLGAAFDEAKRRGRLPRNARTDTTPPALHPPALMPKRSPPTDKRRAVQIAEVSLTRGQVNAIRAAFKAGITPSRIARQFGVSQSNVRKALASDEPGR